MGPSWKTNKSLGIESKNSKEVVYIIAVSIIENLIQKLNIYLNNTICVFLNE